MMMLLLAAFLWGSGNIANKTVLDHIGPYFAVALRCCIATLIVAPFALRHWRGPWSAGWARSAVGVILSFAAAVALQQHGFQQTTVTNAGFLVNTCSILTPCLAWALLGEKSHAGIIAAAMIALCGIFLMTGAGFSVADMRCGDLICLASAVFYATWMVLLGRHLRRFGQPVLICAVQFGLSAAALMALAFAMEQPATAPLGAALPELLYLGVISTGLAFLLQMRAQQYVSSSCAAVVTSAESLFGAIGAYLVLQEHTTGTGIIGAALILCGIGLAAYCPMAHYQPPLGNGSDRRSARRKVPAG
jgi:drug/metabolite transporter (DMT)-like permease